MSHFFTQQSIRREAFSRCPETCHNVQEAIEAAVRIQLARYMDEEPEVLEEAIENVTSAAFNAGKAVGAEKLRDALIECEEERMVAQDKLSDANSTIDRMTDEVASLEENLSEVRGDLRAAQSEISQLESQLEEAASDARERDEKKD